MTGHLLLLLCLIMDGTSTFTKALLAVKGKLSLPKVELAMCHAPAQPCTLELPAASAEATFCIFC